MTGGDLLKAIDKLETEQTELEERIGELELLYEQDSRFGKELMSAQDRWAEVDDRLNQLTDILMSI
jgi:predicted nuclease with TOPRIM domain